MAKDVNKETGEVIEERSKDSNHPFYFICSECSGESEPLASDEYVRLPPAHHWVCSKCLSKGKFTKLIFSSFEKIRELANGTIIKIADF